MKRRGFLGLLGVAAAVPFVPAPAAAAPTAFIGIDLASATDRTVITVICHLDGRAVADQVSEAIARKMRRRSFGVLSRP